MEDEARVEMLKAYHYFLMSLSGNPRFKFNQLEECFMAAFKKGYFLGINLEKKKRKLLIEQIIGDHDVELRKTK